MDKISTVDNANSNHSSYSSSSSEKLNTICCGKISKHPVAYFCQVIAIFIVIIACVLNLSLNNGNKPELWASLLSGCLGYLLPAPKIKRRNEQTPNVTSLHENVNLFDTTVKCIDEILSE